MADIKIIIGIIIMRHQSRLQALVHSAHASYPHKNHYQIFVFFVMLKTEKFCKIRHTVGYFAGQSATVKERKTNRKNISTSQAHGKSQWQICTRYKNRTWKNIEVKSCFGPLIHEASKKKIGETQVHVFGFFILLLRGFSASACDTVN